MIKVLHMGKGDSPISGGGASGSMFRVHTNLRKAGIDSQILCEHKISNSPYVILKPRLSRIEDYIRRITSRLGSNDIHRISSFRINRHKAYKKADLVHFHGIHGGFINYLALPTLTKRKAAVFTLRDMWCLTGHCAVSYDCTRWKTGCGKCPYPDAHPPVKRDATNLEWKLKNWIYSKSNLTIVSLSMWLMNRAKQSMLKRFPVFHIPNGIDTATFKPLDSDRCRSELGIPRNKKILMFAANVLTAPHKGGDLLLKSLIKIPRHLKSEIILLLVGNGGGVLAKEAGIRYINLGYVSSDRIRATAYCAADLFVSPTRAESFGQVILESMACGTPVVCFKIGPLPELVRHGINGYLAEPENSNDLCSGIVQLLEDEPFQEQAGKKCRAIVRKEYSAELEARRHIDLYQQILQK